MEGEGPLLPPLSHGVWNLWVRGIGWGGQRLYVFPALDLVVAQHCGNYNKSGIEQRRISDAVITEIVLPGLV